MTISLRELQENFQAYILNENQKILNSLSPQLASDTDRIDIYKKGYSLRLLEILQKDFPILYKRVGEDIFEKMGRGYIEVHPSDNFNVCAFSRHFKDFLSSANYETYLAEMAGFEWALSRTLDAADAPQINVADLSEVLPESWPYIQFDFHPSAAIYKFDFNVPKIVLAMMWENDTIPELVKEDPPKEWLVWRLDYQSYFESLAKEQAWMVHAIRQGKTFGEICQGLSEWLPEDEVAMYAAGTLRGWLEKGLFTAIRISEQIEQPLELA